MLWKCLGEKHILPNITDLDELKLAKVKHIFISLKFNANSIIFSRLKNMQKKQFYSIFEENHVQQLL
jgi:hypothetical protein